MTERRDAPTDDQETDQETDEERAEREAAGLAPGEEWEAWWERCWFCPRALKTVQENVNGVCASCQAQGWTFPKRPRITAEEARTTLERLVREEVARRPATAAPRHARERTPETPDQATPKDEEEEEEKTL